MGGLGHPAHLADPRPVSACPTTCSSDPSGAGGLARDTQPAAPGKALAVPASWCNGLLPAAPGEIRNGEQGFCERQCCLVEKARVGPILGSADG